MTELLYVLAGAVLGITSAIVTAKSHLGPDAHIRKVKKEEEELRRIIDDAFAKAKKKLEEEKGEKPATTNKED